MKVKMGILNKKQTILTAQVQALLLLLKDALCQLCNEMRI